MHSRITVIFTYRLLFGFMRSSVFKYIFVLDIGSLPYALAITLHMNMLKEYKFIVTKKIFWDKCNDIMFI